MDSFSQYRDRIGQTLTERLAKAIGDEVVTIEEGSIIAGKILDRVRGAGTHEELVTFIEELAREWPLFGPVLIAEQTTHTTEDARKHDEEAVEKVENLLKENRLEEAIETAEKANEESSKQATEDNPPSSPPQEATSSERNQQQGGIN